MRNLKCCIIDDEPLAIKLIESYVNQIPFLSLVGTFSSASSAVHTMVEEDIDLVFLDIQMAELNGLEFALVIPQKCRIIFITAFTQYAPEAFSVNALDYLMKPVSFERFSAAVNKAHHWFEISEKAQAASPEQKFIMVKSDYKLIQIAIDDITFIESMKDYAKIMLENGQNVTTLASLNALEDSLDHSKFMRVHRSYIVNLHKIKMANKNVVLVGEHKVPISESYRTAFNNYISQHIISSQKDFQD